MSRVRIPSPAPSFVSDQHVERFCAAAAQTTTIATGVYGTD
jgi:hypothetical protein